MKHSDGEGLCPSAEIPEGLSLRDVFPSSSAEGARLPLEYLQWLCEERGRNSNFSTSWLDVTHTLWDTLGGVSLSVTKAAQVELKRTRPHFGSMFHTYFGIR